MTESYIGLKKTNVAKLRQDGVNIPQGITAIRVDIGADGSVNGSQWTVHRKLKDGAMRNEFVEAPLDLEAIRSLVKSKAFVDDYEKEFGIKPGQPFAAKSPAELLAEAKACPDWADIEAAMLVEGKPLSKMLKHCGIAPYKLAEVPADAPVSSSLRSSKKKK